MSWLLARLLREERRRSAALRAQVRALELAVAIAKAKTERACEERDRARATAAGLGELPCAAWDATDDAILGAWLNGERGPA